MLLTLDLSTSLGWTVGPPAGRGFLFGTYRLPASGENIGLFARAYGQWLIAMLDANEVKLVVFEAPILPRETRLTTARKLYGLAWHTEFVCWMRKIECFEVHLQSVKKYVTGNGRADKRQMMEGVRRLGFDAETFDEADAIGVRLYTLCERFPEVHRKLGLDLQPLGGVHPNHQ